MTSAGDIPKTALQVCRCTVSPGVNCSHCDWAGLLSFGVRGLQQDCHVVRFSKMGFSNICLPDVTLRVVQCIVSLEWKFHKLIQFWHIFSEIAVIKISKNDKSTVWICVFALTDLVMQFAQCSLLFCRGRVYTTLTMMHFSSLDKYNGLRFKVKYFKTVECRHEITL